MALTIKEFEINEVRAKIGKPLHGMKIANFYYGDDLIRKVPNVRAYGGMRVAKVNLGIILSQTSKAMILKNSLKF